jgi:hypothetical protein
MMAQAQQFRSQVMVAPPTAFSTAVLVQETVERILDQGKITRADQHVFRMAFLVEEPLSEVEQIMINWVFDNLRRGTVRVVD